MKRYPLPSLFFTDAFWETTGDAAGVTDEDGDGDANAGTDDDIDIELVCITVFDTITRRKEQCYMFFILN